MAYFFLVQTATHEDVIFVSETVGNPVKIVIDQVKRLALQRDIDKASKASEPSSALVGRAVKITKNMIVEGNVKKKKGMAKLEQKQENTPLKKEKKKKKENTPVQAEEASADGDGEVQVKKKGSKKKPADPVVASKSHDTEVLGEDGGSSKKKKKKKGLENGNPETEEHLKVPQSTAMTGKENGQSEGKKKKKKKEKTSTQSVLEEDRVAVENEGKEEEEGVSVVEAAGQKGKKKKKKGEAGGIVADGQTEASDVNEGEGPKRKMRKRPAVATDEAETPDVGDEGETEEGVTKTKKGKGKAGVEVTTPRGTKTKNSSGKRKGGEAPSDTQPQVEEGERKKGKKKKKKAAPANEEEEEEEEAVEVPAKMGGKRKRQPDGAEEEPAVPRAGGSAKGKKGGKNRAVATEEPEPGTAPHRDTGEENADAPVTKKRKKKKMIMIKEEPQSCDDQGTVEFLSEKTGNADEVNIDQNRRLALQREIDQESQPKKPAVQAGLGQWSTAQFDNANQQQKFLRLMGGFKKGAQPMAAGAGRANMALGKEEQQKLQQGLQGEFERAQARRMDFNAKGLGLGFSAPSNKKFSIDVNACKSVRFFD